MRREANKLVIHRGVAPIPNEMLVRINGGRCLGTPETVFIRNRLSGPAHHEVIGRRFGRSIWHRIYSGAATPAISRPSTGVGGTSRFSVGGRIGRTSGGNAKASGFDSSPAATSAKRFGFHPRVPLWEWLICMAVAAAVGAMMVSF